MVTKARMSFSEALGEGDIGSFEHAQELFLAPEQASQQMIEGGVAGSALEDAVELRAEEVRLFRARCALVILQAPIEPPDRPLGDRDGVALSVVGGDELVDEALGVDPAQRVVADAELAGVVGNDNRAGEQALGLDRAPQRRFAGEAHRIGVTRKSARPSACK